MAIRYRTGKAFTLVELLVVIAVIGILMAIMLPAIQRVRETARRVTCSNNIGQIAKAAQQYRVVNQDYFPFNWGVSTSENEGTQGDSGVVGHSWLTMLLLYLDHEALYNSIAFGYPLFHVVNNVEVNRKAATTRIPAFICPSDTHGGALEGQILGSATQNIAWAVTNYKGCLGMNWAASVDEAGNPQSSTPNPPDSWWNDNPTYRKGRTANYDYTNGFDFGNGAMLRNRVASAPTPPPKGTAYTIGLPGRTTPPFLTSATRDIRDGTSNTFLIGEALPEICTWSAWYWWDGATATCAIPLNYKLPQGSSEDRKSWKWTYSFMSRHLGGANFGYCDGSVHFVPDVIVPRIYQALATIDGGDSLSLTQDEITAGAVGRPE